LNYKQSKLVDDIVSMVSVEHTLKLVTALHTYWFVIVYGI